MTEQSFTRVNGMSDAELANVLSDIEQKKHRSQAAKKREAPIESIRENNLIIFDRNHFQRRSHDLSKQRARREEGYDGPTMSPPPRMEDKYTHRCPDCNYLVNMTDIHGYKRLEIENSYDVKNTDCPTCTPAVKRYQNSLRARGWITQLVRSHVFTDTCNLPDDADSLSFAEFDLLTDTDPDARQVMQSFAEGKENEVFLYGDTGVGKTGLAISALHEIKAHGTDCLMLTMKTYLDMLREDMKTKSEEQRHIRQIARAVPVMLIDDLGVERITETGFAVEETMGLISDRHAMGLRTVITSNLDLEELKEYWSMESYKKYKIQPGNKIVSRLAGWYRVVHVTGIDQRIGM